MHQNVWLAEESRAPNFHGKTFAVGAFLEAIRHIRQHFLKQTFICKFLIVHVLFIRTTESRNLMCIFPQTQEFSLLELRNYFCWRRPFFIYVVSDFKLTIGG